MRYVTMALVGLMALPAVAEQMDCAAQADFVMELVTDRRTGVDAATAQGKAEDALDEQAGAMLVDWIYALPEDQLTDAVGTAWKAQCEAL